ncbi:MAG: hypothetical protein ACI9NC_006389 [Verrucomicrobiales bacterium]
MPVKMYFRGNHPHRSSSSSKQSYHARINDIVTSYISCFDQEAGSDIEYNLTDDGAINRLTDSPLAARLLAFERGSQLIYNADGSTNQVQLDFAPDLDILPATAAGDQIVLRVHHEIGFALDLRTGIIVENPNASLWTFINPLLPPAVEFFDV